MEFPMRVFSGIQPTGDPHFGNYSGGFRQYVATQDRAIQAGGQAVFCIVDLHAITIQHDPAELQAGTLDIAAMLFATGLDAERSIVFVQSHVTAHAEAAWLLSAVTSYGQLQRMTQFKEKGEGKEFVSAGLFTYPVLMAGDILLYQTDVVPIGDDQRQHLELSRDIAERFNARFGETFRVPEASHIHGAACECCGTREGLALRHIIAKVERREPRRDSALMAVHQHGQTAWITIGQRTQQQAVHHAKDGGRRANPERHREYGDAGEHRLPSQHPTRVTHIREQETHQGPPHRVHLRAREPSDFVLDVRNTKIVDRANPSTDVCPEHLCGGCALATAREL